MTILRTVFYTLLALSSNCDKFDPTKVNYCEKFCPDKTKSTGCECQAQGTRTEVDLQNVFEFRKLCLDEHNYWRNYLASGSERRKKATSASDMMALSYSLELEFLARCYGRSTFNGYHEDCRMMSNNRQAGQNLAGLNRKNFSLSLVKVQIWDWYNEIENLAPDMFGKFRRGHKIEHFATMVWGQVNQVGCARIYTADTKKDNFKHPVYVQALICDYGSTILGKMGTKVAPNWLGRPIYTKGKPCSKCPDNLKCNRVYTALCGEIEPVPQEPPYQFNTARRWKIYSVLLYFGLLTNQQT
ncbi:cysteine-rich venom protein [Tribolium castaneum]|uniref:Venom allergen 5-like Protein n=1 Tax=Tribolium castaneum TaxID=7070 RepID=D2A434_TRICA|nr:PREDICTED: venom allergen 5 [Tribolium castaneum]EFA05607.2 Venom allergen 5-like Protein [Tribolium castaneum]|eukprot:XP_001808665.1 PREDICTED: venom allergen 5 [Tribolium castaneum]